MKMVAVFFATSVLLSTVALSSDAGAFAMLTCGRDWCVDQPGDCTVQYCVYLGNGLGSDCRMRNADPGTSCGSGGTCYGTSCISSGGSNKITVSGPTNVKVGNTAQFSATATPEPLSGTRSIELNIDGSVAASCNPNSPAGSISCQWYCSRLCGSGKWQRCCNDYSVCTLTPSSPSTCSFQYVPSTAKTYSYYAKMTETSGSTAQSSTLSFTATAVCNNNGVCNAGESSLDCSDCGACVNNGICELTELTTCSDCSGVCDKDGVCETGEANKCPSDCPSNYTISLDPPVGVANIGDNKTTNVSLSLLSGSVYVTSLSASNVPSGASVAFSPASCTPPCYSNATINTSGASGGSYNISFNSDAYGIPRSAGYNLTIVSASCNGDLVCDYPETQSSCSSDCFTTASMPSPVSPGQIVTIIVEFEDSRYLAGGKVSLDLRFDSTTGTAWDSSNGCSIGGVKLGPTNSGGTTAWPSGTTSENGHFEVTSLCTIPSSISNGAHTLFATPTIY